MPPYSPEVIIHGGFHKTGTTHLQRLLKRNQGYLDRRGVRYVHHRETRKELTVPVQAHGYFNLGISHRSHIDHDALRAETGAFFTRLAKGKPDRLLLSDENLAGHCGQCVRHGNLYPHRAEFARVFAKEIPYPVAELHLATRNQADFFAAAYGEYLRSLKPHAKAGRFVSEEMMKRGVLERMPSWSDVLADVQAAFPNTRIVLWRYEDYSRLVDHVLSNLCGESIEIGKFKKPKAGRVRPSASGRAVKRLLQIEKRKGPGALVQNRVKVQEAFPAGPRWPRYDPWSAEERAALEATYAADWEKIRSSGAYRILAPEPALEC